VGGKIGGRVASIDEIRGTTLKKKPWGTKEHRFNTCRVRKEQRSLQWWWGYCKGRKKKEGSVPWRKKWGNTKRKPLKSNPTSKDFVLEKIRGPQRGSRGGDREKMSGERGMFLAGPWCVVETTRAKREGLEGPVVIPLVGL